MASTADDAVRLAARADSKLAADLAATAAKTEARALASATTAASRAAASSGMKSSLIAGASGSGRATLAQSTDDAARLASNQRTALKNENPAATAASEKTAIDAAASRAAGAENLVKRKFNISTGAVLAGVGLTGYMTYTLVTWTSTDGKTITITNVKRLDSQRVQISYNPPSNIGFAIRVNDTLDFSGCSSSRCTVPALGNGERVDSLIDDHNLIILKSIADPNAAPAGTPSTTSPAGAPVPSAPAPLSGSWGSAVVHSSFSNQFVGAVSDTAAIVLDSAAEVANAVVNAAAPVVSNAIDKGVEVGKNAFCDIVPFVCDTTFLWICAGICIFLLIGGGAFMLISKKK
jgi:hypothetical protein